MRVAFPEGDNETMMRAVRELADEGLAQCVLVGDGAELARLAGERGISLDGIEVVDVTDEAANAGLLRALPRPSRLPLQAQGRGQAHDAPPGARPHHAGARRR